MDASGGTRALRQSGAAAEAVGVLLAALSTLALILAHLAGGGEALSIDRPLLDGSGGYAFLHVDPDTGLPARFDPCASVAYVVNPSGAPNGAVDDVHEAFSRAAAATGMTFEYRGQTEETPAPERQAYQPERYGERWAPVLVAWTDLTDMPAPHRSEVLGWATQTLMTHPTRQDVVVSGMVVLASEGPAVRPGFGRGRRWGNVALHEVGHLLGLDHTHQRGEIMYPDAGHATGDWGEGDLAGLAHLGRDAGCLRTPDPR
jgi:hypothetical protein